MVSAPVIEAFGPEGLPVELTVNNLLVTSSEPDDHGRSLSAKPSISAGRPGFTPKQSASRGAASQTDSHPWRIRATADAHPRTFSGVPAPGQRRRLTALTRKRSRLQLSYRWPPIGTLCLARGGFSPRKFVRTASVGLAKYEDWTRIGHRRPGHSRYAEL